MAESSQESGDESVNVNQELLVQSCSINLGCRTDLLELSVESDRPIDLERKYTLPAESHGNPFQAGWKYLSYQLELLVTPPDSLKRTPNFSLIARESSAGLHAVRG
jgi:hypothetical protein